MDPFLGEIRMVGFNFPPIGYATCDGSLLGISQNSALFALLGTTFGGNGTNNFALPDLRSRIPLCFGQVAGRTPHAMGDVGGAESVQLNTTQMPLHNHTVTYTPPAFTASGTVTPKAGTGRITLVSDPTNNYMGTTPDASKVYTSSNNAVMGSSPVTVTVTQTNAGSVALQPAGGTIPVPVLPPFLALNFIIATAGVFPSRQ
jgi:microcystin-dependent protein